jgi:hypothetical protein
MFHLRRAGEGDRWAAYTPYDNVVIKVHTGAGDYAWVESPFPIDRESFPIDSEGMVRVPSDPGLDETVNDAVIASMALDHTAHEHRRPTASSR